MAERTHGGKREGAGRKPLGPANMARLTVMLPPDLAEWIKARPEGASAFMRRAIERQARDSWWFPDRVIA